MARKYKFKKTLREVTTPDIIIEIRNMGNKLPGYSTELPDIKWDKATLLAVALLLETHYNKHKLGDHAATILMNQDKETIEIYFYDNAEYIEEVCCDLEDPNIGLDLGLVLYAEPAARESKILKIEDGEHEGDAIATFPKDKDAYAYVAEGAIVDGETVGEYKTIGASGTTKMFIHNLKPGVKYLIRIIPIYTNDFGTAGDSKPFSPRG